MKAAVIDEHGGPGSIRIDNNFPDPEPGPEDVVIKVGATTLNYHDIFTRKGMPGIKVPMPCICILSPSQLWFPHYRIQGRKTSLYP